MAHDLSRLLLVKTNRNFIFNRQEVFPLTTTYFQLQRSQNYFLISNKANWSFDLNQMVRIVCHGMAADVYPSSTIFKLKRTQPKINCQLHQEHTVRKESSASKPRNFPSQWSQIIPPKSLFIIESGTHNPTTKEPAL